MLREEGGREDESEEEGKGVVREYPEAGADRLCGGLAQELERGGSGRGERRIIKEEEEEEEDLKPV